MKKTILIAVILVSFFMVSCGNAYDNYVDQLAEIQCQGVKLQQKMKDGDESAKEELKELREKMIALGKELGEKYPSEEERKKMNEDVEKAFVAKGCKDVD